MDNHRLKIMSLDKKRREVETVNETVETTSSMEYVSPQKKYMIYQKPMVRRSLSNAEEVLDSGSEYLTEDEISALEVFVSNFKKSRTHTTYNVAPEDYVELVIAGLNAIEGRTKSERYAMIEENPDDEVVQKIQYLFANVKDIFEDLKDEIIDNFDVYTDNPLKFQEKKTRVLNAVDLLYRAYAFEFSYFQEQEIEMTELDKAIDRSAEFWKIPVGEETEDGTLA